MPYEVAATTWTNLLGCKTYKGAITLDAIRDFGRLTWGRYGGEPVDGFGPLNGPTPANPSTVQKAPYSIVPALVVMTALLAGCGGDSESDSTATTERQATRQRRRKRRPLRRRRARRTSTQSAAARTGWSPTSAPAPAAAAQGRQPEDGGEEKPDCDLRLNLKDEGHNHIPVAGRIQDQPADLRQPRRTALPAGRRRLQRKCRTQIDFVHSLEHGRMEIQYSPDLPGSRPAGTEGPLRHDVRGDAALPERRKCPTRSRRRPGPTCSAARATRARPRSTRSAPSARQTWGKYGGEPVEAFTFTGPTPAEPEEPEPRSPIALRRGRRGRSRPRRGRR